ncbi:hypothetical protein [Hyphomicrobium sp.]
MQGRDHAVIGRLRKKQPPTGPAADQGSKISDLGVAGAASVTVDSYDI